MGAHKRGLTPQIDREYWAKVLPGKSGLVGAEWLSVVLLCLFVRHLQGHFYSIFVDFPAFS